MKELTEFYKKVLADEKYRNRLYEIIGKKDIYDVNDDEIMKIGELAVELGYSFSIEKVKSYLNKSNSEIDDDDLDSIAGGKREVDINFIACGSTGSATS